MGNKANASAEHNKPDTKQARMQLLVPKKEIAKSIGTWAKTPARECESELQCNEDGKITMSHEKHLILYLPRCQSSLLARLSPC